MIDSVGEIHIQGSARRNTVIHFVSHRGGGAGAVGHAVGLWEPGDPPSCCSSSLRGKHESKPTRLRLGDQLFPGVVPANQPPSIHGKLHLFPPGKRNHQSHEKLRCSDTASSSGRERRSTVPAGVQWLPFQGSSQGLLRYSCPGCHTRDTAAHCGQYQPL